MKKLTGCVFLFLMAVLTAYGQQRQKYEFRRNLPVYADSLLKDLTYPMAWGNSTITDFNEWKKTARQKVFDCMLAPPPLANVNPNPNAGKKLTLSLTLTLIFSPRSSGRATVP